MTHAAPPTPPPPSKSKADLEQVRALLRSLLAEGRNDEAIEVALSMLGQLQAHNADLAWQVLKLRREQYGRRSERVDPAQLSLLLEVAGPAAVDEESDRADTAAEDAALTAERETLDAGEPAADRGRPRRRRPPRALPREVIRHELPEAERLCGGCGAAMPEIGVDVSELVELVPAHFLVEEHHRVKYACGRCKDAVRTAPGPVKLIEKGLPGPGLLAHVAMSKYQDALPLSRLVEIYRRGGFETSVSTLCGWVAAVAAEVKPVVNRIREKALASFLVQTDGSGLKVLDRDDPEGIRKGTMWTLVGDRRYAVFLYARDGTGGEGPWRYLEGREGYLQADASNVFDRLYNGDRAQAVEVGCWAHARRRLHDLVESDPRAAYPLQLIAQLYRIEDLADRRGSTPAQRLDLRRNRSRAIADRYHRWLRRTLESEPPASALAKACAYSLNHWTALTRFLEEACLPLDNNLCELQIRSLAVGRRNYLFAGSDEGAERAAILYSLLRTCALHRIDTFAYLVDLLRKLAGGWPQRRIDELLPENWVPTPAEPTPDAPALA
jgi:transposase